MGSADVVCPNGRFYSAGPVYLDLEIICSTIFYCSLRNREWHKGKKHRHPRLHLNLFLREPVDPQVRRLWEANALQPLGVSLPIVMDNSTEQSAELLSVLLHIEHL